jgi:hypothetical protein
LSLPAALVSSVPGRLQAGKECFDMREWEQKYDQHKHDRDRL